MQKTDRQEKNKKVYILTQKYCYITKTTFTAKTKYI